MRPGTSSPFGALKQVDAGSLSVGFAEAGPPDGPAVILLHGWPYDIHSFDEVVPLLTASGHRVVVPYLRGYGSTRFLSAATPRNGQPAALAVDTTALMDALRIDRAIVDKNARIADGVVITPEGKPPNFDADNYFIRDGIVVIPKDAVIPAGFWI